MRFEALSRRPCMWKHDHRADEVRANCCRELARASDKGVFTRAGAKNAAGSLHSSEVRQPEPDVCLLRGARGSPRSDCCNSSSSTRVVPSIAHLASPGMDRERRHSHLLRISPPPHSESSELALWLLTLATPDKVRLTAGRHPGPRLRRGNRRGSVPSSRGLRALRRIPPGRRGDPQEYERLRRSTLGDGKGCEKGTPRGHHHLAELRAHRYSAVNVRPRGFPAELVVTTRPTASRPRFRFSATSLKAVLSSGHRDSVRSSTP